MTTNTEVKHCCEDMAKHIAIGDVAVAFIAKFREYGIWNLDGGTSYQEIRFCPWCGSTLPESLRDKWFDTIQALGLKADDVSLPKEFLTQEWWLSKKH